MKEGFCQAAVPRTILDTPELRQFSASDNVLMPPPSSILSLVAWKTAFTVDGTANTEKQYGPDGPMNNWCLNTFVFNQDSTLYRTGRIDTGNMGHRYRSTGGYDFYNSPDHTFGYTDADASGTVNSVAFYHGWWNGDVDICVSHINVYVLGVPEPGFLALGLIALVAFLRRR